VFLLQGTSRRRLWTKWWPSSPPSAASNPSPPVRPSPPSPDLALPPLPVADRLVDRRVPPAGGKPRLTVEDIVPIATGHEREELEGFLKVRRIVACGLVISGGPGPVVRFGPWEWVLISRSARRFAGEEALRHGCPLWPLRHQGEVFSATLHNKIWAWDHACWFCLGSAEHFITV
jgi:hypothetical protein